MRNETVDALGNIAARMSSLRDRFTVEILCKPSIPDNINNLRVFYDDQHILHFMANADVFKDASIDEDEHEKSLQDAINDNKGTSSPWVWYLLKISMTCRTALKGQGTTKTIVPLWCMNNLAWGRNKIRSSSILVLVAHCRSSKPLFACSNGTEMCSHGHMMI